MKKVLLGILLLVLLSSFVSADIDSNLSIWFDLDQTYSSGQTIYNDGSSSGLYWIIGNSGQRVSYWEDDYWFNGTGDPGCCSSGILQNYTGAFGGSGDSMTFCSTIHITDLSHSNKIINNVPGGHKINVDVSTSGKPFAYLYDNPTDSSTGLILEDTTYHLCLVFNNDANTIGTYINGANQDSRSAGNNYYYDATTKMYHNDYNDGNYFEGYSKDFKIWNRALSATDIEEAYLATMGLEDSCTPPTNGDSWIINMSDNCTINNNGDAGNITFINTGEVTFNSSINASGWGSPSTGQTIYIDSGALIRIS